MSDSVRYVPLARAKQTLVDNGVDPARPDVQAIFERYLTMSDAGQPTLDFISLLDHEPHSVVAKALTNTLAMPNWPEFTSTLKSIFGDIRKEVHGGAPATYIPILAEANRDWFSVSVCTVDGQQFSYGDTDVTFSIQSCVKPLMYGVAARDRGLKFVHRHVGFEPSGLAFNEVSLNQDKLPHNPMINPGAISTGALVGPGMDAAARFRYFMSQVKELAGGHKIGFSHATYLCEHETAWRNNALVAYMTDAGVFPKNVVPSEALDFYLQCCSIEVDTVASAAIAATLANGGVCPLTDNRVLSPVTTKATLTLMFSCGMYDYSGTWMSQVGLPAKSGVAGLVYIVIPHVMGIAIFSPPLDSHGNSVRGVEFAKRLLQKYKFGLFDQIVSGERTLATQAGGARAAIADASAEGSDASPLKGGAKAAGKSRAPVPSSRGSVLSEEAEAASVATSKSGGSSKAAGGAKAAKPAGTGSKSAKTLEAMHRVLTRLSRVYRAIRMIRVWCGLPCTPEDLAALKACAAEDLEGSIPPELATKGSARGGEPSAPYAEGSHLHSLAWDTYMRFKEFRAYVAGSSGATPTSVKFADATEEHITAEELAPSVARLPLKALLMFIEHCGVSTSKDNPYVFDLWSKMKGASADGKNLGLSALFVPGATNNLILRAMLGQLAIPNIRAFVSDILSVFETVKRKETSGKVYSGLAIEELTNAPADAFGVSVVTVDGQLVNVGDYDAEFPLMATVRPLLYALACKDVGVGEVHRWVAEEPTAADPATFTLMHPGGGGHGGPADEGEAKADIAPDADMGPYTPEPDRPAHPRPFNPFLDSGALAVSTLVGRAHYPSETRLFHDNGSRFAHMIKEFEKWTGGRRVGFSNSVFLAQKQKRLKTLAISYYLKGMSVYPANAEPTETANVLFQAEAVQMSSADLAVIAATLANIGVCPLTQERCLSTGVMRSTLSLMYNSGMCQATGRWSFLVGIPSSSGESGATMLIIPGVMGMVIYSPRLNELGVAPRAQRFCEMLTARYRLNIFDQVVYSSSNVEIAAEGVDRPSLPPSMEQSAMQFDLCTAASNGDVGRVTMLLDDGADPNIPDYDGRTALHIACSDGQEEVVRVLLEAGADILCKDRWGSSPLDDAVRRSHTAIVDRLRDELFARGHRAPVTLQATMGGGAGSE